MHPNEYRSTRKSGTGGRQQKAREVFARVVTTEQADTSSWLGLAFACAQLGDNAARLAAADKSLHPEPRNIGAIIFKADHLGQQGESTEALELYERVLRLAVRAQWRRTRSRYIDAGGRESL